MSPRNPALASHMARLRLAEMSGLGFDRIFRSVALLGKEPPTLEDGPRFRVGLPGGSGNEAYARFLRGPSMPANIATDVDLLTVLTALRHNKSVNASALSARLQRNATDTERTLARMRDAGVIQPTKGTARRANPNYVLTAHSVAGMRTAITYRTDSIDSDDEKLLRHLKRHRKITNGDVRNYLDCDINTARNRLPRLRKRGLIDFAELSPRRGPAREGDRRKSRQRKRDIVLRRLSAARSTARRDPRPSEAHTRYPGSRADIRSPYIEGLADFSPCPTGAGRRTFCPALPHRRATCLGTVTGKGRLCGAPDPDARTTRPQWRSSSTR